LKIKAWTVFFFQKSPSNQLEVTVSHCNLVRSETLIFKANKLKRKREEAKSHLKVVEAVLHKMEATKTQTKINQNINICFSSGTAKTLHKL